jgi:hypothetical protein
VPRFPKNQIKGPKWSSLTANLNSPAFHDAELCENVWLFPGSDGWAMAKKVFDLCKQPGGPELECKVYGASATFDNCTDDFWRRVLPAPANRNPFGAVLSLGHGPEVGPAQQSYFVSAEAFENLLINAGQSGNFGEKGLELSCAS